MLSVVAVTGITTACATVDLDAVLTVRACDPPTGKLHRAGRGPGLCGGGARKAGEGAQAVLAPLAGTAGRIGQRALVDVHAAKLWRPAVAWVAALVAAGGFVVAGEAVTHQTVLTAADHAHSLHAVVMDGGLTTSQFVAGITAGGGGT